MINQIHNVKQLVINTIKYPILNTILPSIAIVPQSFPNKIAGADALIWLYIHPVLLVSVLMQNGLPNYAVEPDPILPYLIAQH